MWGSEVINGRSLGNVLSATLTLPTGSYYVRLRSRNALGNSASTHAVSFRIGTQLASPTGLTADWSGTQTTLTWVASSADSPEMAPTDYVLEAGTAPGLADVAADQSRRETSFSTDVPYGVYYVRVRAINDHGDSNPTEELVVAAPGSARAPEALSTSGEGTTVTLSWSPPADGSEAPAGLCDRGGQRSRVVRYRHDPGGERDQLHHSGAARHLLRSRPGHQFTWTGPAVERNHRAEVAAIHAESW